MKSGESLDTSLQKNNIHYRSLNSRQKLPTSFSALFKNLPSRLTSWDSTWNSELESSMSNIISLILVEFPNNIYWDFDFLFLDLARSLERDKMEKTTEFIEKTKSVCGVFQIFGIHSSIKFRYIHDFLYGYDWYKWMMEKKEPIQIPDPFGLDFLKYISNRGKELCLLIQENDAKYPDLDGQFRNPFLFSRKDSDERKLLETLSETNDIPILAWDWDSNPKFEKNYSKLRLELAEKLGIKPNPQAGSHKV